MRGGKPQYRVFILVAHAVTHPNPELKSRSSRVELGEVVLCLGESTAVLDFQGQEIR